MWRVLVFLVLLLAAAFGATWIAERPGTVAVSWGGYQAQTTAAIAAVLVVGLALALILLWALARFVMALPTRLSRASAHRRHSRGLGALSRGMIAVGAGDATAARRHAAEASRLLGREPLALLLKAQAAQIAGDRPAAEDAFRTMLETDDTRVLGLRGLYVEARRLGNREAARTYATEAARLAPAVGWANDAVLEGQCAEGDWKGALDTVERRASLGLVDSATSKRQRAVLLTADALARGERDTTGALASAQDAARLAPDLVPAAVIAGRLLADKGDLRKASRIVEAAWKACPHPDLAHVYLHLRPGDAALDRLKRAQNLARLSSWHPEARLAVARAAMEARDFGLARQTIEPNLESRPDVRTCLLMAELERAEHGTSARAREWLARAAHAPRGPAWIADGLVSDRWSPISPVSGRLDAFTWGTPPDLISGAGTTAIDNTLLDIDDRADDPVALAPPSHARIVEAPRAAQELAPVRETATVVETRTVETRVVEPRPAPVAETARVGTKPAETPAPQPRPAEAKVAEIRPVEAKPAAPKAPEPDLSPPAESPPIPVTSPPDLKVEPIPTETPAEPAPAREASVTPLPVKGAQKRGNGHDRAADPAAFTHPPDDPGPKPGAQKPSRFKLFG
ncbi:heme biosynthesis protein HemY [Salinarimonas soli]|uniref:heme biosynthesis protein HemY n=1 Tax=Salinarimonas soli TaxID=1638099 RepID=UPI001AEEDC23|nr:heme biosynthesis HemY N-terminal domain-containing protein [Salinarimonas soli]